MIPELPAERCARCISWAKTRCSPIRTPTMCATAGGLRIPGAAGDLPVRDGRVCRRAAPGSVVRREGRHVHQHRAPHSTRARGIQPAGRGPAGLAGDHRRLAQRLLALEGRGAAGRSRLGLRLAGRDHGRDRRADPMLCRGEPRAAGTRRAAALAGERAGPPRHADPAHRAVHARQGRFHAVDHLPPRSCPTPNIRSC